QGGQKLALGGQVELAQVAIPHIVESLDRRFANRKLRYIGIDVAAFCVGRTVLRFRPGYRQDYRTHHS
ncbi:MAG: hypothetical protein JXA69_19230, partial [Phycisphaerae bacterium]|nr:hypothetical protein [Phycisphaerae bacterium]